MSSRGPGRSTRRKHPLVLTVLVALSLPSLYLIKYLTQEAEQATAPATELNYGFGVPDSIRDRAVMDAQAANDKLEKNVTKTSDATLKAEIEQMKQQLKAQSEMQNEKKVSESSRTIESKNMNNVKKLYSGSGSDNWKLWHTMTPLEQHDSLERAFARALPYGTMLSSKKSENGIHHNLCRDGKKPMMFGKGGEHMVCGPPPDHVTNNYTMTAPSDQTDSSSSCSFFSFGIRDDPSWDIHMSKEWKCRGFAGDPSIVHPSKLHGGVTFHNIGLNVMRPNVEQKVDPEDDWILVGLPQLKNFLGWDHVDIVKIDCEGCEVALSRDILADDPSFLDNVGQISIETHGTKTWVNTTEELYYYALMFPLLEDAGFKLIWSHVFGCGKWEHDGCRPEMED